MVVVVVVFGRMVHWRRHRRNRDGNPRRAKFSGVGLFGVSPVQLSACGLITAWRLADFSERIGEGEGKGKCKVDSFKRSKRFKLRLRTAVVVCFSILSHVPFPLPIPN